MEKTHGFYDLCIPYNKNAKVLREILLELIELGYKTIAIEQFYDHTQSDKKNKGTDIFPEPCNIQALQEEFKQQLRILQRLTIIYSDGGPVSFAMGKSLNIRKFNLIAGQPINDDALTHCCTTFPGDLLCFDPENETKLMVNRKAFILGVKRGLFFEIKYAFAIRDSNNRKHMIKTAHSYCIRGKSKNIIFSSGARNPFELRGPYDVANLAFIFGLSDDQGKNAVNNFCRQLFLRAESRRLGKTIMYVKATGPIVFSDSDEEESKKQTSIDEVKEINMAASDSDDVEFGEQPNKKQKIS